MTKKNGLSIVRRGAFDVHRRPRARMSVALIFVAAAASCLGASTWARPWKPTPAALAQNYTIILDNRGKHDPSGELEMVLLLWFVPQLSPESPPTQALLDKYVFIGISHAYIPVGGNMRYEAIDALEARDGDDKPLTLLTGNQLPPAMVGLRATADAFFRQSLGPMGQGVHWFVFDGGAVHACGKGRLSVPFAGETYTYDTPIPGCPKA